MQGIQKGSADIASVRSNPAALPSNSRMKNTFGFTKFTLLGAIVCNFTSSPANADDKTNFITAQVKTPYCRPQASGRSMSSG